MYGFDHGEWMFGGGGVMMLGWMLMIVLVIALLIYFFNRSAGRNGSDKTAMEILMQRYARGEINKEEFDAKRRDLSS